MRSNGKRYNGILSGMVNMGNYPTNAGLLGHVSSRLGHPFAGRNTPIEVDSTSYDSDVHGKPWYLCTEIDRIREIKRTIQPSHTRDDY